MMKDEIKRMINGLEAENLGVFAWVKKERHTPDDDLNSESLHPST